MNEFEKAIREFIAKEEDCAANVKASHDKFKRDLNDAIEDLNNASNAQKTNGDNDAGWKNVVIRYKSGREEDAEIVGVKEGSVHEAAIALMAMTNAISQGDKERAGRLHDCISAALEKHFRNELMRVLIGGMR